MSGVLVFDIETVADLADANRDEIAALAHERQMTAEHYGALCPPLARVVCIAWFDVAAGKLGAFFDSGLATGALQTSLPIDDGSGLVCAAQECPSEADVLQRFGILVERHCAQPNARLVTFNGRGFDLPVLVHRAIKHGVTEGRALLVRAAAENRYRPLVHVDLMDIVTFYGAAPRWPLAAYAMGLGFKSPKTELRGADVWPAVQAGRILDVVRYCAGDVMATAHVYGRVAAHLGGNGGTG